MADKILIIERSATFRAKLKKALSFSGREIHACELFEQAATLLAPDSDICNKYKAIIIGWPSYTDRVADSILVAIRQKHLIEIPVLIFSEDGDPAKLDWITRRSSTALLSWNEVSATTSTLNELINEPRLNSGTEKPKAQRHNVNVLLVDDSPTIRHNFRLILESDGYDVEVAASVTEAFKIAARSSIDIAVIDYFMPDENGDELIRQLKGNPHTAGIEVAVLTGGYSDQIIRDCLNAGATDCMFKNEGPELFLARINSITRNALHKRELEQERNRHKSILSAVGDGIYGVDDNGTVKFINPAARELLGHSSNKTIIGELALATIHHSRSNGKKHTELSCPLHRAYLQGNILDGFQTIFWTKEGLSFPVECTLNPIKYNDNTSGAVIAFRDISKRLSREAELEWQASHDPLTQLMNREAFEEALIDEVSKLKLTGNQSALVFIDIDRFKYINDTSGHMDGDKLLVEVSNRLSSQLGKQDRIARVSGDEFAIILSNIDPDPANVMAAANRFREVIECQKFYVGTTGYSTTITAGIAMLDETTHSITECMSKADQACNLAKNRGRNCIHIYNAVEDHAGESGEDLGWATKLRDALVWNRFQIHFQPIIAIKDIPVNYEINSDRNNWEQWTNIPPDRYEALVRLRDADGKLIQPEAFLPLAERFEMINKIDRWVIENTFKQMSDKSWPELEIYINMSVITLMASDLHQFIENQINITGINPNNVVFEITESSAVRNIREANHCIGKLRDLGLRFALDDFGSGYSSFYHLKNLDVDIIKIDGIFTRELEGDSVDKKVMLSINDVAHSLGKQTVVEHVDRPEVLNALIDSGIDYMQGYLLSEPLNCLPDRFIEEHNVV